MSVDHHIVHIPYAEPAEPSIFRVPACYRRLKPDSYSPAVISFGPYHHGVGKHLQKMELQKERVLEYFFSMVTRSHKNALEKNVRLKLGKLMRCYSGFEQISQGEEQYIRFLMARHRVDIVSTTEKPAGKALMKGAEEFARRVVKDVNIDEFSRFMVWGHDTSRHMVTQNDQNSTSINVRDVDISQLMERHDVENMISGILSEGTQQESSQSADISQQKEFTPDMLKKCVKKFAESLVNDGLSAFTALMIRDGVFLISQLVAIAKANPPKIDQGEPGPGTIIAIDGSLFTLMQCLRFSEDDPVFGKNALKYLWPFIRRDLLLIENQIPLRLIHILLDVLPPQRPQVKRLYMHVLWLLRPNIDANNQVSGIRYPFANHMLDLYKRSRILDSARKQHYCTPDTARIYFLKGVRCQSGKTDCFNDITYTTGNWLCGVFSRTATLYLPKIMLDDYSACVLLNIVAFERLHRDTNSASASTAEGAVTLYVIYMARLLRKPLHVKIMQTWYKVNLTNIWTREDIVEFFQMAARGIPGAKSRRYEERGLMRPFTWKLWLWPAIIVRFMLLLLIEDRGRWFGYLALIIAIISFWCTLFKGRA